MSHLKPSPSTFRLTQLCAALLSLGLATAVSAQSTNDSTGNTATTPKAQGGSMTNRDNTAKQNGSMNDTSKQNSSMSDSSKQNGALSSADRKFVQKAASGGMFEVQLGQLAETKASSDQVKQFGQKMTEEHSKANDELKQLASSKGVQLPSSIDKTEQKELQKLQKLSGADFDREYMKHMVSDHKKDVSEFQKEAKSGKDSDVKSFASNTLTTLDEHLKLAQTTYDSVKQTKK